VCQNRELKICLKIRLIITYLFQSDNSSSYYYFTSRHDISSGAIANGSFTGLMGLIERREVDVLLGSLNFAPERFKVADFPDATLVSR